jgi:hypothetical protein
MMLGVAAVRQLASSIRQLSALGSLSVEWPCSSEPDIPVAGRVGALGCRPVVLTASLSRLRSAQFAGREASPVAQPVTPSPANADAIAVSSVTRSLTTLFLTMAAGDKALADIARKATMASTADVGTILYRQDILRDCLAHESVVRGIYRSRG